MPLLLPGRCAVLLLLLVAQPCAPQAQQVGIQCYINGDGVGVPQAESTPFRCAPGEWCVAKNYYGDLSAAMWPLDAKGEKCSRFCQKMDIVTATTEQEFKENQWDEDYMDDEQTQRMYFQDTGIHLTMTCYNEFCNEFCLDEDSATHKFPGLLATVVCVIVALASNHWLTT